MEHPVAFAALVGVDWSDTKHDLCLVDTATGTHEFCVVKQRPEALNQWALGLRTRFGGALP